MDEAFTERVLRTVERIPLGRAVAYGHIAEHLQDGYGPRYVGRVMKLEGHGVPWWRVVRADGSMSPELMGEAQVHWLEEGTPTRNGRVDMKLAVWDFAD